jgi:hypothetical protein
MPHYFFDLTDDKIIHDFKGKQLRDHKQAREHALIIAREVVTTKATLLREPISDWSITVKDGKFKKLFSVSITDAMPQQEDTGTLWLAACLICITGSYLGVGG